MVQMYFQTVSETKPSIAPNYFANNLPDQIRSRRRKQSYYFILHIHSVSNPQPHQISNIHLIY